MMLRNLRYDNFEFDSLVDHDAMFSDEEVEAEECSDDAQRMDFLFRAKLRHKLIVCFDGLTRAKKIVSCSSEDDRVSIDDA
jgi:hypothetical protein